MCGRFVLQADYEGLQLAFPEFVFPDGIPDRFNIAPTQTVLAARNDGSWVVEGLRWGLVPSWAKDMKMSSRLINARAETVSEKPSFRSAFRRRRCLIPASGYYEWVKTEGWEKKQSIYIALESGLPLAFAGIWEIWHSPEGDEVHSCSILTTDANKHIESVHHRMPVILRREDRELWLDREEKTLADLVHILVPYQGADLVYHPVSTVVNSPANNTPECIAPLKN